MKKVFYTSHLEFRMKVRGIPYSLPEEIYRTAKEYYFDRLTFKKVAVKKVRYRGRLREIAVIYEETQKEVNIITIHPLKVYQKKGRVNSGRWRKI